MFDGKGLNSKTIAEIMFMMMVLLYSIQKLKIYWAEVTRAVEISALTMSLRFKRVHVNELGLASRPAVYLLHSSSKSTSLWEPTVALKATKHAWLDSLICGWVVNAHWGNKDTVKICTCQSHTLWELWVLTFTCSFPLVFSTNSLCLCATCFFSKHTQIYTTCKLKGFWRVTMLDVLLQTLA